MGRMTVVLNWMEKLTIVVLRTADLQGYVYVEGGDTHQIMRLKPDGTMD